MKPSEGHLNHDKDSHTWCGIKGTVYTKTISVPAVHSSLVPSLSLPVNIVHNTSY